EGRSRQMEKGHHRGQNPADRRGTAQRMKKNLLCILLVRVAQLLVLQGARAFSHPPIKILVRCPAGRPPPLIARIISGKMSASLGQPMIVENKPGAGGTIGAKSVLTAEPDGHTLMMGSTSNLLIAPSVYRNAGYDAARFAPVARVSDSTEVLAVHPSVSAH